MLSGDCARYKKERDEALAELDRLRKVEAAALAVDLMCESEIDLSPGATQALNDLRAALSDESEAE